jgi:hypothetical protein
MIEGALIAGMPDGLKRQSRLGWVYSLNCFETNSTHALRRLSMAGGKNCLAATAFAAVALVASIAWALGEGLGETKEQLKLQYDVSLTDHGTGRMTVNLTIADQGRLKPLESVDLVIPSNDGTGFVDLSVPLATKEVDGKLFVRVHLKKELAERAVMQLRTHRFDGKETPRTWYYHEIPLAKIKTENAKKN